MDHQGTGGSRLPTGQPRQQSWPPPPGPGQYRPPPGTGPRVGPATTGPQRAARGYPPREVPDYPLVPPAPQPGRGPVPPVRFWDEEPGQAGPDPVRRPPRRRRMLLALAAVLILGVAGAGAYKLLGNGNSAIGAASSNLTLPTDEGTSSDPLFSAKLGKWQHIDTRKLDPAPVTIAQLYPPAFIYPAVGGIQFLRASANLAKTCGLAVFGDFLQAALQSGGCDQVARASYVSGDQKIMGTIGVANLSSTYWAQKAAKTTGAQELIAPLTATKGPTRNFLKSGTGLTYAEIKGHYLILLYVEFTDLKAPATTAQKQQLLSFATYMFAGSANISLSQRLLGQAP